LQEKRINENAINKAKEFGYNATSQYNFEFRSLISPNWQNSDTFWRAKDNDIQTFINGVTLLENCKNSIKFPYNEFTNVVWGTPSNDHDTENAKLLKANRLAERISISKEMILSEPNIESTLTDLAINAIYQKLFSTMFSTASANTQTLNESPSGLIDTENIISVSAITDIIALQNDVDKYSDKAIWLVSPEAKKELNTMQLNTPIFYNNKLLNSDYICTNLVEDGYLIYIDLQKVALAQFGVIGITVDNYTHAKDGYIDIIIDTYFDYSLADTKYISVGQFSE